MQKKEHNPDILSCLANLSSDEVFTPPNLANQMLDMLPQELFSNEDTTFLDPCCKSGVFLREIAKRLIKGLENEIPDLQKRLDHIFTRQLFGISITELTSLISRRSLYCSKRANGKYSVCRAFNTEGGNIHFDRIDHTWHRGRCRYCGANESEYDRDSSLETHAYHFIHDREIFNMKFDVIVGNPPYQLSDGGFGGSAKPIYQHFVEQAKKLNPRFLTMIIPARWFSGGKGSDDFRKRMLNDNRLRIIHDFWDAKDCFAGVEIKGGACYFLWDRDNRGLCKVVTHYKNVITSTAERSLLEKEADTFIRYNEAIDIKNKVKELIKNSFQTLISSTNPFGFSTDFKDFSKHCFDNSCKIYANKSIGYVNRQKISSNFQWLDSYKIYISSAYGAGEGFPHQIINKPFLGEPNSCCTGTYLLIGPFNTQISAENVISYIKTKFFRFLVLLKKNTQHAPKGVYQFVPLQDFNESWTDEKLYKKYGLTQEEIDFIESMVRPCLKISFH